MQSETSRGLADVSPALVQHVFDVFAFVAIEALELIGDRRLFVMSTRDQRMFKLVHVDRLGEVVGGAVLGCLHRSRDAPVAGQHNDPCSRRPLFDRGDGVEATVPAQA